jgi:hypothetical protein
MMFDSPTLATECTLIVQHNTVSGAHVGMKAAFATTR